jgi:hypothetical protein
LSPAHGGGDYLSSNWLNLEWTAFAPLDSAVEEIAGVYRIVRDGELLYLGESKDLSKRINHHRKDHRFQGSEISYNGMQDPFPHQLKEREVDLIGAYYLAESKTPPRHQYRGH